MAMKVAVCTVGIDGWEEYTKPLVASIYAYEPQTTVSVIDNASDKAYPDRVDVHRVDERLCYAAALNLAKDKADEGNGPHDWYIFLGNDTLCTAPFYHILRQTPEGVMAGSGIYQIIHYKYISGASTRSSTTSTFRAGAW
jgi:hypothetical protein